MNRAKLIKRRTTTEQKESDQATPKPAEKTTVKAVKEWLTDRRAMSRIEARQAFAALFT